LASACVHDMRRHKTNYPPLSVTPKKEMQHMTSILLLSSASIWFVSSRNFLCFCKSQLGS